MILSFTISYFILLLLYITRNKFIMYVPLLITLDSMIGTRSAVGFGALPYYVVAACVILWSINIVRTSKQTNKIDFKILYIYLFLMLANIPFWDMDINMIKRLLVLFSNYLVLHASLLYFDDISKLKKITDIALISLLISVIYFVVVSIFRYGNTTYSGTTYVYLGNFSVFSLSYLVVLIVLYPAMSHFSKRRLLVGLISIIGVVLILLITKRNYIIMLFFSYFLFFLRSLSFQNVRRTTYPLLLLVLFGIVAYQVFSGMVLERYYSREQAITQDLGETNRVTELMLYKEFIEQDSNPVLFSIFGKDYYSSGSNIEQLGDAFYTRSRKWHTGVAGILYGLGVLGMIIFILFWLRIFNIYKAGYSRHNNLYFGVLDIQAGMLMICVFMISTFEAISSLHSGTFPFIYLGGFLGYGYHTSKLNSMKSLSTQKLHFDRNQSKISP